MKLAAMDLENFRCFEKLHIEFDEKLTVLVGANGAGKTAVLDCVAFFLKEYADDSIQIDRPFDKGAYRSISYPATDIHSKKDKTRIDFSPVLVGDGDGRLPVRIEFENHGNAGSTEGTINYSGTNWRHSMPHSVVVCYSASREVDSLSQNSGASHDMSDAYENAFNPRIDFSTSLAWFIKKASEEALEAVRLKDMNHKLADLSATRAAIAQALGDYNEPYVAKTPPDLFITHKNDPDTPLTVRQLSDGYRTMLALVMDLARRMAVANADAEWPEGQNVLHSPGIVLIDEVEQHLHPAWQQTVLPRLMEIFPNVQFIVTTHSPQVLTSIGAKHIRILDGGQVYDAPQGTWGAEASRLLKRVFGVDNRPPSPATDELNRYADLVYADQWNSDEARKLRGILDERYGQEEPMLTRLDLYIANRRWEQEETAEARA